MFDKFLGDSWRNFSVPWYDPALDANTEVGKRLLHRWLVGSRNLWVQCLIQALGSGFDLTDRRPLAGADLARRGTGEIRRLQACMRESFSLLHTIHGFAAPHNFQKAD